MKQHLDTLNSKGFIGILTLATALLTGCDSQIATFVQSAIPSTHTRTVLESNGPTMLKVSPGHILATGTSGPMSINANVTPTHQVLTSTTSNISANISISRWRTGAGPSTP